MNSVWSVRAKFNVINHLHMGAIYSYMAVRLFHRVQKTGRLQNVFRVPPQFLEQLLW